jgi:hypothetical protein
MRLPARLEFFSLGGILGVFWKPHTTLMPWLLASFGLGLLSCWDLFRGRGGVDLIVMGLAAYELAIGLTEEPALSRRPT